MKRIPIAAARRIAEQYGYDPVDAIRRHVLAVMRRRGDLEVYDHRLGAGERGVTHDLVRKLFKEMRPSGVEPRRLAAKSGVPKNTITSWREIAGRAPSAPNLAACFDALGFDLRAVRRKERSL